MAALSRRSRGVQPEGQAGGAEGEALADVDLPGCGDKMPQELSGGDAPAAAFARTMLTAATL